MIESKIYHIDCKTSNFSLKGGEMSNNSNVRDSAHSDRGLAYDAICAVLSEHIPHDGKTIFVHRPIWEYGVTLFEDESLRSGEGQCSVEVWLFPVGEVARPGEKPDRTEVNHYHLYVLVDKDRTGVNVTVYISGHTSTYQLNLAREGNRICPKIVEPELA